MEFPKQLKDIMYELLREPTLEKLREFLHSQTGEHNSIDFKGQWIENAALAKEILALSNSQGGIIVFGVSENDDKTISISGLPEILDKATISNSIKNYISSNLKYEIYDFVYNSSEYDELIGKKLQMLVVEDTPEFIPFLSKRESGSLKQNMIYVRRGTSCEIANEEELQIIFKRRINYLNPLNGEPLNLEEHLKQLKILYREIEKEHVYYKNGLPEGMRTMINSLAGLFYKGETIVEPNPLYPSEGYEEFISRMIVAKKKKIERVVDIY
ncbi:MAG: ATP-binding protein [Erysipelotrichales bacterium]|nr:ATP-binding protein [Erysipelotrichales bacterium]